MSSTEKAISSSPNIRNFNFHYFPAFAGFILLEHFEDYVKEQIAMSREADIPLLKLFSHLNDEQLLELGRPGHQNFLTHAKENKLNELLENSLNNWRNDRLVVVGKNEIAAEDITLISYVRKKVLMKFLSLYTSDVPTIMGVVNEIDLYETVSNTEAANTYINLLKERIDEHAHFIENITNTTPGLNYVMNIAENRLVYANKNHENYIGYTVTELGELGDEIFSKITHPEDKERSKELEERFKNAANGEIVNWEQRIKNNEGEYRWFRNHASVFRRNEEGVPVEIAGIAIDINDERKIAEALRQSEEGMLEAQEVAEMASYEMDVAADKLIVTPNFYKITGLDSGFERKEFLAGVHPGDRQMANDALQRAIEGDGIYDCEYRYVKDGKEKILWSRGILDAKSSTPKIKGTLMDVTERHHMIQQLQRGEKLYKQAQALSHIGNWSWLMNTDKVAWSEELYNIFEVEDHTREINFELYMSFIHPADRELLTNAINKVIEHGDPYDITHRIVLENGKTKVLQSKGEALTDPDGIPYKLAGTCQDITDKYYTEQRLYEQQAFIHKVANTTPSLIATYNINTGRYTYLNQAFTKILGYEVAEVMELGLPFFVSLVHPEDMAALMEKNNALLAQVNESEPEDGNEIVGEFKYRLRHKDGSYHWFHTYGTIFDRNAEGKVEHILNVSVDITEQEEAEQALYHNNILLQQSNSSLEEFAYVASHDLKEPLRKIATFGDRLIHTQYERLDDSGKMFINKIIDSSRRMQTMVNDLLALSTISGNKTFSPSDLKEVLDDAIAALEFKIEEKKAVITAENLPVANIVASQFRHLFQNMLSNSLKFAREGVIPEIKISAAYLTPQQVNDTNITKAERYLSISISDNGIGFDNQYAAKIFTIFQRLHSKSEYEGNGIGLSICRKIAENHRGSIFAEGILDEGSTFTIIIPS